MASVFQMLPLIARQMFARQTLPRTPEPHAITDATDNVLQYDRVMETKLSISYAIAIETIYRARPEPFGGRALDICCGPGHFSITLARHLRLDSLTGVDLSAPMIEVATQNAADQQLEHVRFETGDATRLEGHDDATFDLVTMLDAAHHMPSLELVTDALRQMHRVAKPDGLVVLMDLVRLKTEAITEKYVHLLAHDYVERGLPSFYDDFRNSMYAAWTPGELVSAVPRETERTWTHIVPKGLPFAQFLIGKPKSQSTFRHSHGPLWSSDQIPLTAANRSDFRIAKTTMATATVRTL